MVDKPGLCNLEFAMGAHGLVWKPGPVEGPPEVERVSCQARLLGVKPGWTIHMVNGIPIEKSSQAWSELLKCKKSGQKYSVYFVKDEASIQADKQKAEADKAKKAKEQEDRRKREEAEKRIREEAEKKREEEKKSRKEAYAEKQEAAAKGDAAPAAAAAEAAPAASWNFANAKVLCSNIGGQGPDNDKEPCLLIGECLPGVNIKVEVVSDGYKGTPENNTLVPGQGHTRAQVSIAGETANNSMDVKFTFVKADSGEEAPMGKVQMAVYDIDAEEKLTVDSASLDSKAISDEAKLKEEEADGKVTFEATEAANKEALDEARKLELNFAGKASFQVSFSSKGGNLMFSFPSVTP